MIIGIEKLNQEQIDFMVSVNKNHTDCVGLDYKDGMEIIKCWLDEQNTVCVRLKNGDWYHYYSDGSWG